MVKSNVGDALVSLKVEEHSDHIDVALAYPQVCSLKYSSEVFLAQHALLVYVALLKSALQVFSGAL